MIPNHVISQEQLKRIAFSLLRMACLHSLKTKTGILDPTWKETRSFWQTWEPLPVSTAWSGQPGSAVLTGQSCFSFSASARGFAFQNIPCLLSLPGKQNIRTFQGTDDKLFTASCAKKEFLAQALRKTIVVAGSYLQPLHLAEAQVCPSGGGRRPWALQSHMLTDKGHGGNSSQSWKPKRETVRSLLDAEMFVLCSST